MHAAERLGSFASGLIRDPLAPAVREKAAGCLLDTLGVALVARDERTSRATAAIAEAPTGPRAARLWLNGKKVGLRDAVLANAVLAHAHFHDDSCHSSWTHPGSLIVPLAVALGEYYDTPLDTVLKGITVGYTTLAWLGADEAVAHPLIKRGFRGSPVFGTIGAAATASLMLGLPPAEAAHAVSIATNITGGILEPVRAGSDEWRIQNAHAALGGLLAAQSAKAGIRGAPDALAGQRGFLRAFAGLESEPKGWATPPDVAVMRNAMAKPYATLGDNMAACIAASVVQAKGVAVDRIRAVRVKIWRPYTEYPGVMFKGPYGTVIQALASAAFSVSAMLIFGKLGYDIPEHHRGDEAVLALAQRVTILPDDGEYLDASVEVEYEDGTIVRGTSRESPPTRIFQDRTTVSQVLHDRYVAIGRDSRTADLAAMQVFDTSATTRIADVLDAIL
jgi:2-methylcitrate dehydratase PrpD